MVKQKNNKNIENIVIIAWIESERGWGTRPDGCSLHLSKSDSEKYIADYWSRMPREVPDEYSRPLELQIAQATSKLYKTISESKNGIRLYSSEIDKYKKSGDLMIDY